MAIGDGTHKLPVKAAVRKAIGKAEGDTVHVVIAERLETLVEEGALAPVTKPPTDKRLFYSPGFVTGLDGPPQPTAMTTDDHGAATPCW